MVWAGAPPRRSLEAEGSGDLHPPPMRILVIEDNPKMAAAIQKGLSEQGWIVDAVHTGFEGEERAVEEAYDAIVLDLMLPDRDGVEVCKNLRRRGIRTPLVMLTALSGT